MRRMQRAGLAAEKVLGKVGGVPQVEIADLRAIHTDNTKELPFANAERTPIPGRYDNLRQLREASSRRLEQRQIDWRKVLDRIDHHRRLAAALRGVIRGGTNGRGQ
jgi:hypothetical protein